MTISGSLSSTSHQSDEPWKRAPHSNIFLPEFILSNIFSYLVDPVEFKEFSSTCKEIRQLTLSGILTHLEKLELLTYEKLMNLRSPLFGVMFLQNPEFKALLQADPSNEKMLIKIWWRYALPHYFSYMIFHCTDLKMLDLRNQRHSLPTLLGEISPFVPNEIETLTLDSQFSESYYDHETELIRQMREIFDRHFQHCPTLTNLTHLAFTITEETDEIDWVKISQIFPNLAHLEIEGGKYQEEALRPFFPHCNILFKTS